MKLNSSKIGMLLGAIITGFGISQSQATVVTTTRLNNRSYYVDVLPTGTTADVWFRVNQYACSAGDIHVGLISRTTKVIAAKQTIQQAASAICSVKQIYDTGKTIAGCAATVGTAVCLTASVPTGGTTAALCTVALDYTLTTGAKDCFFGVSNTVAGWLAGERNWASFATGYNVSKAAWGDAIDHAIDLACTFKK